jgi:hypothetical protein
MGRIRETPNTAVKAVLEVVGDRGTLVVPRFPFAHEFNHKTEKNRHILVIPNQSD